jgi:uncharacterized protein (DUF427 family)/glutaredoxin
MSETDTHPGSTETATTHVEVLWRPGCPYCSSLRAELAAREVQARWRNIWTDREARELVRAANSGSETVPTVLVGGQALTNPTWRDLAPLLGRDSTEPVPARRRTRRRTMTRMQAVFNGTVIAESDETRVVEGNHYFPRADVREDYLKPSKAKTLCFWKGLASYHDVEVDGVRNPGAAFYYPKPSPLARKIKDHVAFWQGVQVRPAPAKAEK